MKSIMTKFGVFALVSLFAITIGFEKNIVRAESLQKVTIQNIGRHSTTTYAYFSGHGVV